VFAISGARNVFDAEQVAVNVVVWITEQAGKYIQIATDAKATAYPLP
jgi:hypothetical protein